MSGEDRLLVRNRPQMEIMNFFDAVELKEREIGVSGIVDIMIKIIVVLTFSSALNTSTESISSGLYSIKNRMQSLKMGTVVNMTRMEKRKVQIGSAIVQSGFT